MRRSRRIGAMMVGLLSVLLALGAVLGGSAFSASSHVHARTRLASGPVSPAAPPPSVFRPGDAGAAIQLSRKQKRTAAESRRRYGHLDARQALVLDRRSLGALWEARESFYQPLMLRKGERLVRFINSREALVAEPPLTKTPRHRGAPPLLLARTVIAQSTAPMAVGRGANARPVELGLLKHGPSIAPARPLIPTTFSRSGVAFPAAGISVTLEGARRSAFEDLGHQTFSPSVLPATDLVSQAIVQGAEQWLSLRSTAAPQVFHFHVALPKGAKMLLEADDSIKIVDKHEHELMTIATPVVTDATGRTVGGIYSVTGSTLTLTVHHRQNGSLTYPLTVDPIYQVSGCVPTIQDPFNYVDAYCGVGTTGSETTGNPETWAQWGYVSAGNAMTHATAAGGTSGLYVIATPGTNYSTGNYGEYIYRAPTGAFIQRVDFENTQHQYWETVATKSGTTTINEPSSDLFEGIFNTTAGAWENESAFDDYPGATQFSALGQAPYTVLGDRGTGYGQYVYVGNSAIPMNPMGYGQQSNINGANDDEAVFGLAITEPGTRVSSPDDDAVTTGATVWLYDFTPPTLTSAAPTALNGGAWTDDTGQTYTLPVSGADNSAAASNAGLGMKSFTLAQADVIQPGGTATSTQQQTVTPTSCTGDHVGTYCPQTLNGTFSYTPLAGVDMFTLTGTDASGNISTPQTWTDRIDNTPPVITLNGSLYAGRTSGSGATTPALTGNSYDLDASASDTQSGVAEIDVQLSQYQSSSNKYVAVGSPQVYSGQCTTAPASVAQCTNQDQDTYQFNAADYPAGQYQVTVSAKDLLGIGSSALPSHVATQTFYFDNNPANPVSANPQNQNNTLGLEPFYDYRTTQTGAGSALNVNLGTGNGVWNWTPFDDPGQGLDSSVQLTYNSQQQVSDLDLNGSTPTDTGYDQAGYGFSVGVDGLTRLNEPLNLTQVSQGLISYTDIDGTTHTFVKNSSGQWTSAPGVFLYLRPWQPTGTTPTASTWSKTWAITRPDGVTFFFDALGYETGIEDRTGNTITFNYTFQLPPALQAALGSSASRTICSGPVSSVIATYASQIAADGCTEQLQSITTQYAVQGGTSPTVNPTTQQCTGGYSANCINFAYYPSGNAAAGKLETITEHNGHQLTFSYATSDQFNGQYLQSVSYASTRTFSFKYDTSGNSTTNAVGSLLSAIDPSLAGVTAQVFPNHLIAITDPDSHTATQITYKAEQTRGTDPCPEGQTGTNVTSGIPALLNVEPVCVASITARDGGVTSYSYTTSASSAGGAPTHTATVVGPVADSAGNPETWTDVTDQYFRPIQQTDPLGRETTTTWNNVGATAPTACSSAPNQAASQPGNTIQNKVDGLIGFTSYLTSANQAVTVTPTQTAAPAQTNYCYDQNGDTTEKQGPFNPTNSESPTFRDTKTTYALSGGPSFLWAPANTSQDQNGSYVSDETSSAMSSSATTTQPALETTTYCYGTASATSSSCFGPLSPGTTTVPTGGSASDDALDGLVTKVIDPDGQNWTTAYEPGLAGQPSTGAGAANDQGGGNIASETDPDGNTTTYANYTPDGLPGQVTMPGETASTRYFYDADGNLLAQIDPRNPTAIPDPNAPTDSGTLTPFTTYYVYDAFNDVTDRYTPKDMAAGTWIHDSAKYDANGNAYSTVTGAQQTSTGGAVAADPGTSSSYTFTPMDQVQSESILGVLSYEASAGTVNQSTGLGQQITSYCYDQNGNVTFETLPAGQPSGSTYTCQASTTAPANHAQQYYLDGDGEVLVAEQLSSTTGTQPLLTSYAYNARGDQTAESDPADNAGAVAQQGWQGAVTNVPTTTPITAAKWDNATVYDSADDPIETLTNPGIVANNKGLVYTQLSQYDAAGNLLATESAKEVDANNAQSTQKTTVSTGEYAFAGEPNMTSYVYNSRNLVMSSTNPDGDTTMYGRYPDGKICWTLSPRGVAADGTNTPSQSNCQPSTLAANYMTGYTYYPAGWLETVQLPKATGEYLYGNEPMSVTYGRNAVGEPLTITDPRGTTITNTFYADGDLQTTSDPWWWTYDPSSSGQTMDPNSGATGQVQGDTPADGQVSQKSLSELFQDNESSDSASAPVPSDGVSGNLGDVPAQQAASIIPNAGDTEFTYNGHGWLTSVTDGRGYSAGMFAPSPVATTYLAYDPNGKLTSLTQPFTGASQSVTSYTYDPDGNTLSVSTPQVTTLSAQNLNPGALFNGAGASITPTTTYTYDGLDRMVTETAPGASTSTTNGPTSQTTQYCYYIDPTGQTPASGTGDTSGCPTASSTGSTTNLTVAEPSGVSVSVAQRVLEINPNDNASSADYDALGNEVQNSDPLGDTSVYGYDELGDQISTTRPNGETAASLTNAAQAPYTTEDTYDQAGQLTLSTVQDPNPGALPDTTSYTYDADGNVIQRDAPGAGGVAKASPQDEITDYLYNGRDLLWKTTTGVVAGGGALGSSGPDTRTSVTETDGDGNIVRSVNPAGAGTGVLADPYYPYQGNYAANQTTTSGGATGTTTTGTTTTGSGTTTTAPATTTTGASTAPTDPNPSANIDSTINVYDSNNQLAESYLPWGCNLQSNTSSSRECMTGNITDPRRWRIDYTRTQSDGSAGGGDWLAGVSQAYDWTQTTPTIYSSAYTYDPNGWIATSTTPALNDGTKQTTAYTYDPAGDETSQAVNGTVPGSMIGRTIMRSWWPDGQPQEMDTQGNGSSERTYDYLFSPTGELTGVSGVTTTTTGASANSSSEQVCYDAADRPTDVEDRVPAATGQATQTFDTAFGYDHDGNVTGRAVNGSYTAGFTCLNSQQDPTFPLSGYAGGQTTSFSYTPLDQEQTESVSSNPGDSPTQSDRSFSNMFWPSGQIEKQTRQIGDSPANDMTENWYYTPAGQVAEDVRSSGDGDGTSNPYDQTFTYDSDDNRSQDETGSHVYNALNQEVEWIRGGPGTTDPGGTSSYTLDGDGGLLQEVDNLSYTNVSVPVSTLGLTGSTTGLSATESTNEQIVTRHCSTNTASTLNNPSATQAMNQPMCASDAGRTENVQTTSTVTGSVSLSQSGMTMTQSFPSTNKTVTQTDCYDALSELIEVVQSPNTCGAAMVNAATTSQYQYSDLGLEVNETVPDPTTGGVGTQTLNQSYQYDALGRRYQETQELSTATTANTVNYAYVGLSLTAVSQGGAQLAAGGTTTNTYDYDAADNPIGVNVTTNATGGTAASASYFTYAKDPSGTVQALESSSGTVAANNTYHYTPYGEPEIGSNQTSDPLANNTVESVLSTQAQANEVQFQGFVYNQGGSPDPATLTSGVLSAPALPQADSFSAPARNYLPGQGMWQTPDTFEQSSGNQSLAASPLTQDPYTFVAGNPSSSIEVDGHTLLAADAAGGPAPSPGYSNPLGCDPGVTCSVPPPDVSKPPSLNQALYDVRDLAIEEQQALKHHLSGVAAYLTEEAVEVGHDYAGGQNGKQDEEYFGYAFQVGVDIALGKKLPTAPRPSAGAVDDGLAALSVLFASAQDGEDLPADALEQSLVADAVGTTADAAVETDASAFASDDPSEISCGNSFTGTTEVRLADGRSVPIDRVRIGDKVLALNPKTGKTEVEPVTRLWLNRDTDLLDLTVRTASGLQVIHTTQHHLFYVPADRAWVEAEQLAPGAKLSSVGSAAVTVVQARVPAAADEMWDLTVQNVHDFYVVAGSPILVHNCTEGQDDLLDQARSLRDLKAAEVGSSKATVTAGFNPETGNIAVGCSSNPIGCAEDDVARQLGIPDEDIYFTEAVRPRTGQQVPICGVCQTKYNPSQFPEGTLFGPPLEP